MGLDEDMKSQIFYTDVYAKIEKRIKNFLNKYTRFFRDGSFIHSKTIQHILDENSKDILGSFGRDYSANFARRAMADLAFRDQKDLYYVVDVKTHRLETQFNMPNLTSVERLARFYEDDSNYYVILMVAYKVASDVHIHVERVHFVPIEFLSWSCLTIGALGWGQIQIANANNIIINHGYSRKKWMLELCDVLLEFYPHEIEKVKGRIQYFNEVKKRWKQKTDIWK